MRTTHVILHIGSARCSVITLGALKNDGPVNPEPHPANFYQINVSPALFHACDQKYRQMIRQPRKSSLTMLKFLDNPTFPTFILRPLFLSVIVLILFAQNNLCYSINIP